MRKRFKAIVASANQQAVGIWVSRIIGRGRLIVGRPRWRSDKSIHNKLVPGVLNSVAHGNPSFTATRTAHPIDYGNDVL